MTRWLLAASCVVCLATNTAWADSGGPQYVLPPQAESVLRAALVGANGPKQFPISKVTLTQDHVTLTFEDRSLAVTLRHPSEASGALKVLEGFSVHGEGTPKALVTAIALRLADVAQSSVWREVAPAPSAEAPAPASRRGKRADPVGLVEALHGAREALRLGERDKVAGLMAPFVGTQQALSEPSRIDIATMLWRSGDTAGARRMVTGIGGEQSGRAVQWQAAILRGELPTLEALIASLEAADDPCEGLAVATLLDAIEERAVATGVIAHLAELNPACPQAIVRQVRHLLNIGEVAKAEQLSQGALKRHPSVKELVSVRARVLIAANRPKEAASLLESHARRDPRSVALSSLLGAYNRVESLDWKRQKMAEMEASAKADPNDHVAAFIAGVLLHYDGRLADSDAMLSPLLETPLNDQARLYIYLGMNAFDLGDPTRGLELVDRAANAPHPDPDVHYCRAEILRMTDPVAAREALKLYLSYTDTSATKNSAKQGRVAELLENLNRCVAEGVETPCPGPWEHPRGEGISLFDYRTSHPTPYGEYALTGLVALLLLWGLWTRRRRTS